MKSKECILSVLTFPLQDCSEFGNFVITLIHVASQFSNIYISNQWSKFTGTYFIATTLHCQQNNVSEYQLLRFNTIILRWLIGVYLIKLHNILRAVNIFFIDSINQ